MEQELRNAGYTEGFDTPSLIMALETICIFEQNEERWTGYNTENPNVIETGSTQNEVAQKLLLNKLSI